VSKSSSVPDHCRAHALSDPKETDYQYPCSHDHDACCEQCDILVNVIADIEDVAENLDDAMGVTEDVLEIKEELLFLIKKAKDDIMAWKSHLLRSVNQDEARLDILHSLDDTSVLLVQDWAMKFLPRKYRESQSDWFGKRGIPWHVRVAIRKGINDELQMLTFVNVFQNCVQDSCTVVAVMSDVLEQLKKSMPELQQVFYWQDNAGCYHCGSTIVGAHVASQVRGVTIKRMDFCDPQGGKGACDRKAATVKSHMKIYLNSGNNIENAKDMKDAILSSGGIPALKVTVSGPPAGAALTGIKLEEVSLISNIQYVEDGSLRVWKAYNIGPGKVISSPRLNISTTTKVPHLTAVNRAESRESHACFTSIKSKLRKTTLPQQEEEDSDEESVIDNLENSTSKLFPCPEQGCVKH